MAARNSAGRGGSATATKSRSGSGSRIAESDIARLTVTEIREQLRKRGVPGIWSLRKPELVKRLANAMRAESRRGGTAGKTAPGRSKAAATRSRPAAKSAAKRTSAAAKSTGSAAKRTSAAAKRTSEAPAKRSAGTASRAGAASRPGGVRTGRSSSRSLKYAQEITSPEQRPDRAGRSLVTTDHKVIREWAQERGASPATIEGSEREGRPGVLRFDFPGWRAGGRLRQISWNDWFKTFDDRRLNFIYQEQRSDGRQSNFFRLESPDREDA